MGIIHHMVIHTKDESAQPKDLEFLRGMLDNHIKYTYPHLREHVLRIENITIRRSTTDKSPNVKNYTAFLSCSYSVLNTKKFKR